jgi:hypothetical protein
MYLPSGDHVGLLTNHFFSREICFGSFPSTSIVQMFQSPSRSLVNAIRRPSGLKRGCMSNTGPPAIRVAGAVPPSSGIT